ncbi:MAG: YceI family protein [Salinimicrobium sp.]
MKTVHTLFGRNILAIILLLTIFSCKNEKEKEATINQNVNNVIETQTYSIDTSGVAIQWVAYKFTERAGVKGVFKDFKLSSKEEAKSVEDLLQNSNVIINTNSINSGEKIRDDKLRTYFFKVFHTDTISGSILSASNGKGSLALKMNGIQNEMDYNYSFNKDTLALTAVLDLKKWKGEEAIKTLNKECYELHTGPDGVSKLWPDVSIEIKLPIQKALFNR